MAPSPSGEGPDQPIPELLRLGEILAQARQEAGLSPDALAKRVRIEPSLLNALEQGDHSRLPEGVFVVALARRIASVLRVNLDDAILGVRRSPWMGPGRLPGGPPPSSAPRARQPRPVPTPASLPWRTALAALLAASGMASAWLLSSPRQAPGGPSPSPPPRAAAPAPPSPESQSLRLSASEPSWVEVREVAGRTLFEGTLTGEKRFPLGRDLEVVAGRPHAVKAAVGAGPGTPLGGVADIRWKRFSPRNLTPPRPASSSR